MDQLEMKKLAARAALKYVKPIPLLAWEVVQQ